MKPCIAHPLAIAKWKVPDGMTCRVHEFDAREGGRLRVSLSGLAAPVDLRVLWLATALAVAACSALVVHRFLTWKETRS